MTTEKAFIVENKRKNDNAGIVIPLILASGIGLDLLENGELDFFGLFDKKPIYTRPYTLENFENSSEDYNQNGIEDRFDVIISRNLGLDFQKLIGGDDYDNDRYRDDKEIRQTTITEDGNKYVQLQFSDRNENGNYSINDNNELGFDQGFLVNDATIKIPIE